MEMLINFVFELHEAHTLGGPREPYEATDGGGGGGHLNHIKPHGLGGPREPYEATDGGGT